MQRPFFRVFGAGSGFRVGWRTGGRVWFAVSQGFVASIGGILILAGGLGIGSFYGV